MNILSEMEFAFKNGFTDVKIGTETDGSTYFLGTFAYYATSDKEEIEKINALIAKYTPEKETEKEVKKFGEVLAKMFGDKVEIKNSQIQSLLNENIINVERIGKGSNAAYIFRVENDKENAYHISATMTGKGKWWVKRGRSRY